MFLITCFFAIFLNSLKDNPSNSIALSSSELLNTDLLLVELNTVLKLLVILCLLTILSKALFDNFSIFPGTIFLLSLVAFFFLSHICLTLLYLIFNFIKQFNF